MSGPCKICGESFWSNPPQPFDELCDLCAHRELAKLTKELERREKICSEMRDALGNALDCVEANYFRVALTNQIKHALSSACGEDYFHKSEVDRLEKHFRTTVAGELEHENEALRNEIDALKRKVGVRCDSETFVPPLVETMERKNKDEKT